MPGYNYECATCQFRDGGVWEPGKYRCRRHHFLEPDLGTMICTDWEANPKYIRSPAKIAGDRRLTNLESGILYYYFENSDLHAVPLDSFDVLDHDIVVTAVYHDQTYGWALDVTSILPYLPLDNGGFSLRVNTNTYKFHVIDTVRPLWARSKRDSAGVIHDYFRKAEIKLAFCKDKPELLHEWLDAVIDIEASRENALKLHPVPSIDILGISVILDILRDGQVGIRPYLLNKFVRK